jgi:hypothetical protein
MSQQASAVPPLVPTSPDKPKRKWGWLKLILLIVAAAVFALKLIGSYNPVDLELTRKGLLLDEDGLAVEIVNTGTKPTTIKGVQINDRTDCSVSSGLTQGDEFKPPVSLKVGDKLTLISSCRIIRVNVETDIGSAIYSFSSQ